MVKWSVPAKIDLKYIHEVFVYSYCLIEEIKKDAIYNLGVIHSKRDLTNIRLEER